MLFQKDLLTLALTQEQDEATLEEAGFVPVGYTGVDGEDLTGQRGVGGYYTDTGSYVDKFGRGAAYGTTASMSAAAAKAGLTYATEMEQSCI